LLYEDADGNIFDAAHKPSKPNLIMCVVSSPDLPRVGSFMKFPYYAHKTLDQEVTIMFQSASRKLNGILQLPVKVAKGIKRFVKSIWVSGRKKQ
jgi:hypothetical protein